MNKNNIFSVTFLVIFVILFSLMINDVSLGSFGRVVIIWMIIVSLFGIVAGAKGSGWSRWPLFILNAIAFCASIIYILAL